MANNGSGQFPIHLYICIYMYMAENKDKVAMVDLLLNKLSDACTFMYSVFECDKYSWNENFVFVG